MKKNTNERKSSSTVTEKNKQTNKQNKTYEAIVYDR